MKTLEELLEQIRETYPEFLIEYTEDGSELKMKMNSDNGLKVLRCLSTYASVIHNKKTYKDDEDEKKSKEKAKKQQHKYYLKRKGKKIEDKIENNFKL